MAYTPASCDNRCKGCEKNKNGWCVWKDMATPEYETISYTMEKHDIFVCPECGGELVWDGLVRASNPPLYYHTCKCGYYSFLAKYK